MAVQGVRHAVGIDAGYRHACALLEDSTVLCWGDNRDGQLGSILTDVGLEHAGAMPDVSDAEEVTAGAFHTCVVHTDGTVSCWGRNSDGQLGDTTTTSRALPAVVPDLELVKWGPRSTLEPVPVSTPSESGQGPTAAPTASPATPGPTTTETGGASPFCSAWMQRSTPLANISNAWNHIDAVKADPSKWGDPAALESLHSDGQTIVDNANELARLFSTLIDQTNDPTLKGAFANTQAYYLAFQGGFGRAAVDAASIEDQSTAWDAILLDADVIALSNAEADSFGLEVDYVCATCGLDC